MSRQWTEPNHLALQLKIPGEQGFHTALMMHYRPLGRTGIQVSPICLGTAFRGSPPEKTCRAIIHSAIDHGINFVDCANEYQSGTCEAIVGRALKGRRSQVVLTSKVSSPVGNAPNQRGLSRRHILEQLELSLSRLQTDYVDVYYAHEPDPLTPIEESLAAFDDIVRQGKARTIGLSNFPTWQLCHALWLSDSASITAPSCVQNHYNLLDRRCERELVPMCQSHGIAILAYSAVAAGYLAGRSPSKLISSTAAQHTIETVESIASELGTPPAQVAIAWLLHQPALSSVLIGPDAPSHVNDAVHSLSVQLNVQHLQSLNSASEWSINNGEIS